MTDTLDRELAHPVGDGDQIVYVFAGLRRRPGYIGVTDSLRRRIFEHTSQDRPFTGGGLWLAAVGAYDRRVALAIEADLIARLDPEDNKQRPDPARLIARLDDRGRHFVAEISREVDEHWDWEAPFPLIGLGAAGWQIWNCEPWWERVQ